MTRTAIAVLLVSVSTVALSRVMEAQPVPLDPRTAMWDKGPAKIDVSKYPAEVQRNYKTFADLCSRCHSLARAVNCEFALEDDWERYIKRMMRRGKGLISPEDAQKIFEFAVYDSKTRKKELYATRLAARQ